MFIRLQDVTKILDRRIIISSINYEFESGNIYGIVGQMVAVRQCFYELYQD